jgi:hypothetical protein
MFRNRGRAEGHGRCRSGSPHTSTTTGFVESNQARGDVKRHVQSRAIMGVNEHGELEEREGRATIRGEDGGCLFALTHFMLEP